jgi:alpha-galactosidase
MDLSIFSRAWVAPAIPDQIPHGDMPGDKVSINDGHIAKANVIFPRLLALLPDVLAKNSAQRAVVAVCGGSGVGKSETASLLSFYLNQFGIGAYTLSGDNYPHRIPFFNDAERLRIFRVSALRGLLAAGEYDAARAEILAQLLREGREADTTARGEYPWLAVYQNAGKAGLSGYLGTQKEIDFAELSTILARFHAGEAELFLKRMGREETALWYDRVAMQNISVLVVEWTHGNNDLLTGVDIPVLLNSTPEETLAHRKLRARDGAPDSPFTTLVLQAEQELLQKQAHKAKIVVSKSGELFTPEQMQQLRAH